MKRSQVLAAAALAGAVTGLRSMTGPAIVSNSLRSGLLGLRSSRFSWLGGKRTAATLATLAVAELIADKLPFVPDRITAGPLAGRFIGGGLCGAAICASNRESPWTGALVGGLAAMGAAFAGYEVRRRLVRDGKPDVAVALIEDFLAIGGGLSAVAALRA